MESDQKWSKQAGWIAMISKYKSDKWRYANSVRRGAEKEGKLQTKRPWNKQ